jgi:hypothetical protein
MFGALWLKLEHAQVGNHGVRPPLSRPRCPVKEEVAAAVRSRVDSHD